MSDTENSERELVVPLVAEQLRVGKREVITGGVRVRKQVVESTETINEPLSAVELEIEHVPIGRFVDAVPDVRQDGDVTIVSVVEEVAVVQKRLWLREEVHVTRRRVETVSPQTVTLQREELSIEPLSAAEAVRAAALQQDKSGTSDAEVPPPGERPSSGQGDSQ